MSSKTDGLRDIFMEVSDTDTVVEEQTGQEKRIGDEEMDLEAAAADGLDEAMDSGDDQLANQFGQVWSVALAADHDTLPDPDRRTHPPNAGPIAARV
ncbi:hypothetical protein [Halospeciosus flavus]|uniref:hypothetical protein n=1 Tax=Halospeciosus flavus TaxID=3032283 RepID=UPI00361B1B2F